MYCWTQRAPSLLQCTLDAASACILLPVGLAGAMQPAPGLRCRPTACTAGGAAAARPGLLRALHRESATCRVGYGATCDHLVRRLGHGRDQRGAHARAARGGGRPDARGRVLHQRLLGQPARGAERRLSDRSGPGPPLPVRVSLLRMCMFQPWHFQPVVPLSPCRGRTLALPLQRKLCIDENKCHRVAGEKVPWFGLRMQYCWHRYFHILSIQNTVFAYERRPCPDKGHAWLCVYVAVSSACVLLQSGRVSFAFAYHVGSIPACSRSCVSARSTRNW